MRSSVFACHSREMLSVIRSGLFQRGDAVTLNGSIRGYTESWHEAGLQTLEFCLFVNFQRLDL